MVNCNLHSITSFHQHNHWQCLHSNVHYCSTCNCTYCSVCGKEWRASNTVVIPWQPYVLEPQPWQPWPPPPLPWDQPYWTTSGGTKSNF